MNHSSEPEDRLRLVLEASDLGYLDWNLATGDLYHSPKARRILQLDRTDQDNPFTNPQFQPQLRERIGKETSHFATEYKLLDAEGRWKWVSLNGQVVERAPSGAPLRYLATVRDITRYRESARISTLEGIRKDALLTMYKNSSRPDFKVFDETLNLVVNLTQSQFGYIYLYSEDTRKFTLHAWSSEVMPHCTVMKKETVYDLDNTGLWGEVVRQRKAITVNDYAAENPYKKGLPTGHVPLLRFLSVPIFEGSRIVAVTGVANKPAVYDKFDEESLTLLLQEVWSIHQRQELELKMAKLYRAVESSPTSIVITDLTGSIEYVNPRFTAVTGYTQEEVLGQNPRLLKSGQTPAAVYEDLWTTVTSGREWHGELINRRKSGEVFYEEVSISAILDQKGKISHYVAVKEDITQKRRMQDILLQSQKMETVGQLAAGVAHDFNNLLTSLIGYNTMLLTRLPEDSPLRRYSTQIKVVAHRAAELVSGLLSIGRQQRLQMASLELDEFLRSQIPLVHALVNRSDSAYQVNWQTEKPDQPLHLQADRSQLSQVLINLVSNARDARPEEGECWIRWGRRDIGAGELLELGLPATGGYAWFSVADNGPGIPPEIRNQIFEPFFTTKPMGQGTGIGLPAVFGIIKQHHGAVTVDSEPGHGACFTLYLPLDQ